MAESNVIESDRLVILPFSEKYLSVEYVSWLNDPGIVRYSEQRLRKHTLDSCRAYWQSFKGTPNHFWAIVRKGDGLHLGNINAYIDLVNNVADLGILIGFHDSWNKGYGTEAWNAVCKYLFDAIGIRKITAGTMEKNEGMLGIMRKSGMADDGRRIRHVLFEGFAVDMVHGALFRENATK